MRKNSKRNIIIILIVVILLFILVGFIYINFLSISTVKYYYKEKKITLEIPKYSIFYEEKDNTLIFKSLKSKNNIEFILSTIENKYQKYTCRHNTYYYDEEGQVTIISYDIKDKNLFNEIYLTYKVGKHDNNYCNKVTDPTKTSYQFRINPIDSTPLPFEFQNIEENGEIINVHYNNLNGRILFKTGKGYMNYLESMIQYKWITMNDVIEFLEYKVKKNEVEKTENNDIGYIIYKTGDFSLIKCSGQNKDIYIENHDFEYKENYCS